MTTQTRLAVILFVSNVLIILLFGGSIYYSVNKYSYNDFYKRLETRASIAARYNFQADRLSANSLKDLKDQHLERLPYEREYFYPVNGETSLQRAAATDQMPVEFLKNIYTSGRAILKEGNIFYTGVKYVQDGRTYLVIVSARNYYSLHHLSFLKNVILVGIVLLGAITVAFSLFFSRRILRPLKRITSRVKEISTENIHLRLEESTDHNEIGELVRTFNDLLNRLETAFETQKNFISNASHEFATPLTAIIGEADLALIKDRKPEEYKETIRNILQQSERLDQITKSLLFLAQTGYKRKKISFDVLRIDEIIWEVKQVMDKLNPQNKIQVDLSLLPDDPGKLKVRGNKDLLSLAIANIVGNACKYSFNKPVKINIASSNKEVIILIKDQGVGIPGNELQFIYDPFFRASNTGRFEGYGIGLPLSRNIIRLHQGQLLVSSLLDKETTARIELPLVKI